MTHAVGVAVLTLCAEGRGHSNTAAKYAVPGVQQYGAA